MPIRMKAKLSLSVCVCIGLLALSLLPAGAGDGRWAVDAAGNWSDTTKWAGGVVADGAGYTADFSTIDITGNRTVTLDSDRTIGTLKFGDTGSPIRAWTLSGTNTLTLSGSPTISAVVSGQTISIFVALAGTEGLTKTGPGTVTLIKANSYTGPSVILEGALEISSDSHLGTPPASATPGNIVINGGQLSFKGQFDLHPNRGVALGPQTGSGAGTVHIATSTYVDAIPGIIANNGSGTGALVKTGPGTLVLSADNTYSGGTTISNGSLRLGTNSATGSILGNVTNYATLAFNRSDSYTFNGVISGTGSLVQMGSGTVTLTANNTYSGGTTIEAGTLRVAHASALGTGAVTVKVGRLEIANVNITSPSLILSNGATLLGTGTGAKYSKSSYPSISAGAAATLATEAASDQLEIGSAIRNGDSSSVITVSGNGAVLLSAGATASDAYAGSWVLSSGTLRLADANALGNPGGSSPRPITLQGGTLEPRVSAGASYNNDVTVSGDAAILANRITTGAGVTHVFGTLSIGSQQLSVSPGPNVTSGTMGVSFGTTTLTGDPTFNVTNSASASMDLILGAVGESGVARTLTKTGSGRLIFSGAATYTGDTVINGGTLALGSSGSIATSPNISVAAGATFDVAAVSGGFSLASGQTLKGDGTVNGNVTVGSGATLAPGASIGTLTFNHALTLAGNTQMEINKAGSTLTSDRVVVGSTLTYGGTLNVTASGDTLAAGDTFDLFDAATFSGAFATLNLPTLPGGLIWDTSYLNVDGTIRVASAGGVPPTITLQPASTNVTCGQAAYFAIAATGTEPLSFQWKRNGQNLSDGGNISGATTSNLTINPVGWDDAGSYTVVVSNYYGTTTSDAATLSVSDTTPPTPVCHSELTRSLGADGTVTLTPEEVDNGSSDNCGITERKLSRNGTDFYDSLSFGCTDIGQHTITLRVKDAAGNQATCTSTLTVADTTPPVLSGCPPPTASYQCLADVPAAPTVTAQDNCDGQVAVAFNETQSNPGSSCNNTIVRTWTATDSHSNTATCTQTITVNDTTAPQISGCPTNVIDLGCNPTNLPDCNLALHGVSASDDCDGAVPLSCSAGEVLTSGCARTQTFTLTATDSCGNSSQCQVTYTWKVDTTAPAIACPPDLEVRQPSEIPEPATDYEDFVQAGGSASDNCGGAVSISHLGDVMTVSNSPTWFVITRTYQASDGCGNMATCAQTITVRGLAQISGTVSYSTLSSSAYAVSRQVVFKATDAQGTVLKTWTVNVEFVNANGTATGSYLLTDVPLETVNVSAKTAWHLRKKLPVNFGQSGQAEVNFQLLSGDLNGSNSVNIQDYAVLRAHWQTDHGVADINGDGMVQLLDYTLLRTNWFRIGDEE